MTDPKPFDLEPADDSEVSDDELACTNPVPGKLVGHVVGEFVPVGAPEPFKPALDPADCPEEPTHTPEPWSIKYECALPWILGGVDDVVCNFDSQEYMMPLSDEDVKRIVACVNACAGMADPAGEIRRLRETELQHSILTGAVSLQKKASNP